MAKNPLRLDPTRTTALRGRYIAAMRRRFMVVAHAVYDLVGKRDVLGLAPPGPLKLNIEAGEWRFETDSRKVGLFLAWLQEQIDNGILETVGDVGDTWPVEYVLSAYKVGVVRAFTDTLPAAAVGNPAFYAGTKAQFLQEAFASPVAVSKLQLLFTRNFEQLRGITADMSAKMARVLTEGLARGDHPYDVAKALVKTIDGISRQRAEKLARTEIIYAHAEGQLDSFERLGLEEVGLAAEWSTAGDERVCPRCAAEEGKIYSIREAHGLIPLHPNCRCCWLPVAVERIRGHYRKAALLVGELAA